MASNPEMLTERELEEVTAVFKSFETGLREATIDPKVHASMGKFVGMIFIYIFTHPLDESSKYPNTTLIRQKFCFYTYLKQTHLLEPTNN